MFNQIPAFCWFYISVLVLKVSNDLIVYCVHLLFGNIISGPSVCTALPKGIARCRAVSRNGERMTCRADMERHATGVRPWRLSADSNLAKVDAIHLHTTV